MPSLRESSRRLSCSADLDERCITSQRVGKFEYGVFELVVLVEEGLNELAKEERLGLPVALGDSCGAELEVELRGGRKAAESARSVHISYKSSFVPTNGAFRFPLEPLVYALAVKLMHAPESPALLEFSGLT